MCLSRMGSSAATVSAFCYRNVRKQLCPTSPSTRWARWPCRCSPNSDRRRLNIGSGIVGQEHVVTDGENLPKIEAIRSFLPELRYVFVVDGENGAHADFWAALRTRTPRISQRLILRARIPPSLSTLPARRESPRARSMATAFSSDTSLAYNFLMNSSRNPATNSGRPPIGPGPAGYSMCCFRACTSVFRSSRTEPASSTLNTPSISSPSTRCGTHSCRRLHSS